jgi:hypothetical protein
MENQPDIADIVAELLDEEKSVVRDDPCRFPLSPEILQKVPGGPAVDRIFGLQSLQACGIVQGFADHPVEFANAPAERKAPADPLAMPERHAGRLAGGG